MKEWSGLTRALHAAARPLAIAGLAATVAWGSLSAQQPRPADVPPAAPSSPAETQPPDASSQDAADQEPAPQPTFRTGINFVSVDTIVTDRKGNPVTDLTPADFEVLEDGEPQTIETFKLIRVEGNASPGEGEPRPINSTYAEEAEARRDDVRLFVIFFDDYHVRLGASLRIKQDMTQFIQTQLGPKDMIAMMYPLDPVRTVSFTRNHEAVVRAIQQWEGRKHRYFPPRNLLEERYAQYPPQIVERIRNQVSLSALQGLMVRLGGVREGRKSVIVVSEGYTDFVPAGGADPIGVEAQSNQDRQRFFGDLDIKQQMRDVYTAANRNNVSLYMLDPRGLAGFEYDIDQGVGLQTDKGSLDATLDSLRLLADETDGRAIINRNDLGTGLKQMVQDASAYYLLGYSSSAAPTDGKFHQIRVRLKRKGLEVRARKGYWALRPEEAAAVLAGPKEGPPPDVSSAMAEIERPVRARVIRSWVGYAPAEGGKTRVLFSWEPVTGGPAQAGSRGGETASSVTVMAASDADGPLYRGKVPGTGGGSGGGAVAATPTSAGGQVSFDSAPGPMQMRLSAEDAGGSVLDSDVLELTVPDFSQTAEQVGTPALFRARTQRELQTLEANAEARPTASPAFSRTEKVLLRFAATGAEPVARLLNRDGDEMSPLVVRPAPAGGAFTHEAEVPVASLPAGDFLIEVRAGSGEDAPRQLAGMRITS